MPELPPRPIPLDNLPIQMLARQAPSGPSPPPDAKANARGHEMDASECQGLATSILLDLLSDTSEEKLAAKRQESVRTALIARLATHEAEGSDFHHAVLDHVLPKCKERMPLLIAWLHAELAKAATTVNGDAADEPPDERYVRILLTVLPAVRNALPDNDKAYTQFLLDVPRLPMDLLRTLLEEDVADAERRTLGFATARDVCLQRDAASDDVLAWLLEMSSALGKSEQADAHRALAAANDEQAPVMAEDGLDDAPPVGLAAGDEGDVPDDQPVLRRESVRVLASQLFVSGRALEHTILEHATVNLRAAVQPEGGGDEGAVGGEGVGGAPTPAAREALMELHLALCAQRPGHLSEWLRAYGAAPPAAQDVMRPNAASVVPHIDGATLAPLLLEWAHWIAAGGDGHGDASPLLAALVEAFAKAGTEPPPTPLVDTLVELALSQTLSATLIAPLVAHLSAAQAEALLPILLAAPPAQSRAHLVALIHADPPPLPPPRLLLTLHILPTGGGLTMKHLIEGVGTCLSERGVFTMPTMASSLKLIAQHDPLPLLSMRTTIEALVYCASPPRPQQPPAHHTTLTCIPSASCMAYDACQYHLHPSCFTLTHGGCAWRWDGRARPRALPDGDASPPDHQGHLGVAAAVDGLHQVLCAP